MGWLNKYQEGLSERASLLFQGRDKISLLFQGRDKTMYVLPFPNPVEFIGVAVVVAAD